VPVPAVKKFLLARVGNEPLTLCLLTRELARAPDRLGLFPLFALRRFFIRAPLLHVTKYAFALHFLLQDTEGLINVVIADKNLQWTSSFLKASASARAESPSGPRFNFGDLQGVTRHVRVEAARTLGVCLTEVELNR